MRAVVSMAGMLLSFAVLANGGEGEALRESRGGFSIVDVSQYSDGKTYTIDIEYNGVIFQILYERPSDWEVKEGSGEFRVLDSGVARGILFSWLSRNYKCEQLSSDGFGENGKNDYIAGALMDILDYERLSCKRGWPPPQSLIP